MSGWTMIILVFFVLFCLYSLWTKEKLIRMLSSLVFAFFALFCLYGFLASFEPMANLRMSLIFKISYTILFFLFTTLAIRQITSISDQQRV